MQVTQARFESPSLSYIFRVAKLVPTCGTSAMDLVVLRGQYSNMREQLGLLIE
jgi:hypothetical protein